MRLIFGLGNPGVRYAMTRHNVGFMVLDRLARSMDVTLSRQRFAAFTGQGQLGGQKVLLLKPQTYMNRSGRSVGEASHFFQVEAQSLIVVHDEVDLPFGRIKIKRGGGHAGHNGLRDIVGVLQCSDFVRIRIGVGRPPGRRSMSDYVLSDFTPEEVEELPFLINEGADAVEAVVADGVLLAMNRFNTSPPRGVDGESSR